LPVEPCADDVGVLLGRDLHHAAHDARPGQRGTEVVLALVDGLGAHRGVDEVAHELVALIVHVAGDGSAGQGLLAGRFQILLLTDVGAEGHDLGLVLLPQPADDDGSI
jgi:hypothetical protein